MVLNKKTLFLPKLLLACFVIISFYGCDPSRKINKAYASYVYFQNQGIDTVSITQKEIKIAPNDMIGVQVFSQTINQEQAAIFKMPTSSDSQIIGYQVSASGNIMMPVLGDIKAAGLTKEELQSVIVKKLTEKAFVKDPIVIVRLLQFNVYVLGEVRLPGTQKFQNDKVNIITAISSAGDLTDYGKRDNVTVIREENGKRIYYNVDLRSRDLFQSPAYILQPNDIVYVSPDKVKLQNLNVNPDQQRKTGLFFSIMSVIIGAASIVVFSLR